MSSSNSFGLKSIYTCDIFMFCPYWCEFCGQTDVSFLFQGLFSPLIGFCLSYRHLSHFPFQCFLSQVSIFHHLMWFPIRLIPLYFPKPSFPIPTFPVSVLLSSHQDSSYLFPCTCNFASPWPAMLTLLFSSFPWKLQFLVVPESYPLPCVSCTLQSLLPISLKLIFASERYII